MIFSVASLSPPASLSEGKYSYLRISSKYVIDPKVLKYIFWGFKDEKCYSRLFISHFFYIGSRGQNPVDNQGGNIGNSELYAHLGDVNRIYSAVKPRYYTGQIIRDNPFFGGKSVKFEGNIVEYNSIKQEILDRVRSVGANNALMHQYYESIVWDDTKEYVEFSTYTNIETNEVVGIEVRIFWGNFLEVLNTNDWYAKTVMFNPDWTEYTGFENGENGDNDAEIDAGITERSGEIDGLHYNRTAINDATTHYHLTDSYGSALEILKEKYGEPYDVQNIRNWSGLTFNASYGAVIYEVTAGDRRLVEKTGEVEWSGVGWNE
jgi:hypothetical protein